MTEFENQATPLDEGKAGESMDEIPNVYYELADELAEVQANLRKATGVPRPPHHRHHPHHGPHGPHGAHAQRPVPPAPLGPDGFPPRPVPPAPLGPDGFPQRPPEPPLPPEDGARDPRAGEQPLCAPGTHVPFPAPRFAHGPAMPPEPPDGEPMPADAPRPEPFPGRDPRAPHPMDRMGRGTMATLRYLSEHDGQASPGAIAGELRLSNARISNILATLEKRGYVTREHDPEDGRKVVVKLTEEGRVHSAGVAWGIRGELASFLADLGEEDARTLISILKKVTVVAMERRDRAIDAQVQGLMDTLDTAE